MKLGVLFSGGKDSALALHLAAEKETVACLITVVSENKESFMFHTPNIDVTTLQAEALGLPLISVSTAGQKEVELDDLEHVIAEAKHRFGIVGVVTGAVESTYQASRVQRICRHLDLWQFNPLWKIKQQTLLETLLTKKFEILISGVFAYPLEKSWLGKPLDPSMATRLFELQNKYGLSPSGEGGEIETTVLDAPMFQRKIRVVDGTVDWQGSSGIYVIKQGELVPK